VLQQLEELGRRAAQVGGGLDVVAAGVRGVEVVTEEEFVVRHSYLAGLMRDSSLQSFVAAFQLSGNAS
jgi:hypothetical protein